MIIVISPAKTFKVHPLSRNQEPFFLSDAKLLHLKLSKLSKKMITKKMKVSDRLAESIYDQYQHFGENKNAAIFSYFGHQYKHIDAISLIPLYESSLSNLYILSGLYGLLNAFDDISPYRLEMQDKSIGNLYHFWKPKLTDYIHDKFNQEVIYNLCSDEYGSLIKHLDQTITIEFYQLKHEKLSIHSMEVKKMRGLFARHMIMNPDQDVKTINIDGYHFDPLKSNNQTYIFIKEV